MELKVKEVICVIRRGAEPSVEICKSRFLRDTTFHHGGAAAEQRAIAIFRKMRSRCPSISRSEAAYQWAIIVRAAATADTCSVESHGGGGEPPEYK